MSLSGRRAVVTGAGRGIGARVAEVLASEGASVVLSSRTSPEIEAVAERIRSGGGMAHAVPCDVGDADSIARMAEAANEHLGGVDILINNAGIAPSAPFLRVSLDQWETTHRVNATGPLLCTQAFLPGMLEAGWGRIVNVASIASHTGARYITSYAASKHALMGMTRCLALELVDTGVTVNSVCPGYVDTPMTDASVRRISERTGRDEDEIRGGMVAMQPSGRLLTVDEVTHAVMTFLPDEASGMQGSSLVVDLGGLLR